MAARTSLRLHVLSGQGSSSSTSLRLLLVLLLWSAAKGFPRLGQLQTSWARDTLLMSAEGSVSRSVRLFHPAFPLELLSPVGEEVQRKLKRKLELLGSSSTTGDDFSSPSTGLPWTPLPGTGVSSSQTFWSKLELADAWERNRHLGKVVWAEKLSRPEKGCVLLNHWAQKAMHLVDYDPLKGGRGYELRAQSGTVDFVNWPPLSLETELVEKKWQPVRVSENLVNGDVLQFLPQQMTKGCWELIFLLLLEPTVHKEELQALFDTGLSPKQGLIAYLRLLQAVVRRAEQWNDVPEYRKISEVLLANPYENLVQE